MNFTNVFEKYLQHSSIRVKVRHLLLYHHPEFPVIVLPIVTQHYMMLQRNLLYTAITRACKLCVLVGSRRAIGMAVKNNKVAQRFTALEWRLL